MIGTNFFWGEGNEVQTFRKYGNFTCRFTSTTDPTKKIVTLAVMETSPIGQYKKESLPDQIRCRTPLWTKPDTANVEISVNGHDYVGSFEMTFVDQLQILKIAPLSGPIGGNTHVRIYGNGMLSSLPKENPVFVKFGTIES